MDVAVKTISVISGLFTIVASGIAIYLFFFKRDVISSAFKLLLNYSYQITFSELRAKLERLNELSCNEPTQTDEIINILNDIVGQIRGNSRIRRACSEILEKVTAIAENPKKLSEPKKRALVSELRENLRHVNLEDFDRLIGG